MFFGHTSQTRMYAVCTKGFLRGSLRKLSISEYEADSLADGLNSLFESEVNIPRIKHGEKQTLDTLISEEALLLAKYLRNERKEWFPRIGIT